METDPKAEVVEMEMEIPAEVLEWLPTIKPDDFVVCVTGICTVELMVEAVDEGTIRCAGLVFDRKTSAEITPDGSPAGSFIRPLGPNRVVR
jgi:hypothetical protein